LERSVSILICTRSRRAALESCLASVERACAVASSLNVEVVIVDNGSSDDTPDFLRQFSARTPLTLRLAHLGEPGLAGARNLAVREARGDILVFTDDDCELDANYLVDLARRYETPGPPTLRGGRVELADADDAPITIKRNDAVERWEPGVPPGGFVHGCNLTMHRRVAEMVGSFDERFGAGARFKSAEDADYLVRAYLCGVPVEYVPDMVVFHNHGRRTPEQIHSTLRGYDFGNGALYMKHWRAAPWLFKHFGWAARSALAEMRGGPLFDADLNASHWPIILANAAGVFSFATAALRRRLTPRRNKVV
jgi:GT2 family glycosyltransferase